MFETSLLNDRHTDREKEKITQKQEVIHSDTHSKAGFNFWVKIKNVAWV